MKHFFAIVLAITPLLSKSQRKTSADLVITPEKSKFVKTSTYSDVVNFLDAVRLNNSFSHLISMGKSPEGKEIPVLILANPGIKTAEDAKASGKAVIYIQGNIHAGEVEGKEAVMMLIREILTGDKKSLLDNQIILFAPIYNTDSNDKMEKGRRPSQEDSPLEVGIRENSQGLDLNRDGVKMAASETKGLFENIITKWDPQLFVDLHTTNGTWHAYSLTSAPSYHYAGEFPTYDYTLNQIIKSVNAKAKENSNLNFGQYGDYELQEGWPPKNFYTYNHHPRYLVNQFSLRNRMAILSEAFSHERFYQRIHSTYVFVHEILKFTNEHATEIMNINKKAEAQTIENVLQNSGRIKKGVRFKMVPLEKLNNFPTYDYISYTNPDGKVEYFRTGKIVKYDDVTYHAKFDPEVESTLPRGYIIPKEFRTIVDNLKSHGILVNVLVQNKSFSGEYFIVDNFQRSERKFEGHYMATVKGKFILGKRKFGKGDYFVDLAQPLGNLAFYLLEPESDDGLVTWNFFDEYFLKQNVNNKPVEFPVFKYFK